MSSESPSPGTNPPRKPCCTSGTNPPRKPWEQAGTSSGPTPFKPPSAGNTSDVVEASGVAKPGEIVSSTDRSQIANGNPALSSPLPQRPWQQNYGTNSYGSNMNYNTGYGSSMYGSYGGYGNNTYGGGLYGNSTYGGGLYGNSTYGGGLYGNSMYGGGMYNNRFGGPMGGYGGMGGPYGDQDPNGPYGPPSSPPGFWVSFIRVMQGVVNFFGRVAILIDQNTQAFHMFMSALLQLFDRSGMLYGELARFVLRILGIKTKSRKQVPPGSGELPGPSGRGQHFLEAPKSAGNGQWDNVWSEDH